MTVAPSTSSRLTALLAAHLPTVRDHAGFAETLADLFGTVRVPRSEVEMLVNRQSPPPPPVVTPPVTSVSPTDPSDDDDDDFDFDSYLAGRPKRSVEGHSGDTLTYYFADMRRFRLLEAAEEVQLAKAIELGIIAQHHLDANPSSLDAEYLRLIELEGCRSTETMITANLRLVVSIAVRYLNRGLPFEDLVQEGNIGLIHAVEKFDYRNGSKFSTYATWWIKQGITRAIADLGHIIRTPVHFYEKLTKIRRAAAEIESEFGRPPTLSELADRTGFTTSEINDARKLDRQPVSLSTPLGEDFDLAATLSDTHCSTPWDGSDARRWSWDVIDRGVSFDDILESMRYFTDREREIVHLRFGFADGVPRTLDEIGRIFGVTRERIRQIESKALKVMRESLERMSRLDYQPLDDEDLVKLRGRTRPARAAKNPSTLRPGSSSLPGTSPRLGATSGSNTSSGGDSDVERMILDWAGRGGLPAGYLDRIARTAGLNTTAVKASIRKLTRSGEITAVYESNRGYIYRIAS